MPYIFAFSPQMLFVDVTGAFQVVQICISALLGIFGVAAALNGFLYRPIPALLRVAMAVGGLGMMIPGTPPTSPALCWWLASSSISASAPGAPHGLNDLESAPRLPGSTFSHIPAGYKRYRPREKL